MAVLRTMNEMMRNSARERTHAMMNGALIAIGGLGVLDNVIVHWILGWHRAIEGSPYSLGMEIGIVVLAAAMVVTGAVRERRARALPAMG